VSIFQIHYKSEQPNLTVCESQMDEFLSICNGELKYQKGNVFRLDNLGKLPVDESIDIIPYFYSGGILVSEPLYLKLEGVLKDSGQWFECKYIERSYFYFQTSVILDVIDYDASGCKFIDGYMVSIDPIVFKNMDYSSINLFKVPRKEDGKPIWFFATKSFKNTVEKFGVSNLNFVTAKI
jgi:hypothetical protein